MRHTITVSLINVETACADLLHIDFRCLGTEEIKSIVTILGSMLYRLKASSGAIQNVIEHAMEPIHALTNPFTNITCRLNDTLEDDEEMIEDFIATRRCLDLELSFMIPTHSLGEAVLDPYLTNPDDSRLFSIPLDDAEKLDWTPVLDVVFCSCRGCREGY